MTEEEIESYGQLSVSDQIEKAKEIVTNLKGTYSDVFDAYSKLFNKTKAGALEAVREILIDDVMNLAQTYEKGNIGVLVKYDINYSDAGTENLIRGILKQLFYYEDKEKQNQVEQAYIAKYISEKNFFAVTKVFEMEEKNTPEEFLRIYEEMQDENNIGNYFDDCEDVETDEERKRAKEIGIKRLTEKVISSSSENVFDDKNVKNRILADKDKIDFNVLNGSMSAKQQIENADEIIRHLEESDEHEFIRTLEGLKPESKNSGQIRSYLTSKFRDFLKDSSIRSYTIEKIMGQVTPEIQLDLREDIEEYLMSVSKSSYNDIWQVTSDKFKNDTIREILNRIDNKYKDNYEQYEYSELIADTWAGASERVQEENSDLFFEIFDKMKVNTWGMPDLWAGTKKQEKYFEEVYERLQDKSSTVTVDQLWKVTNVELQRKYLEMVLDDDANNRVYVFSNTNEKLQEEYFERKQKERTSTKEMLELYCGLSENLKKDKADIFWAYFEENIHEDPLTGLKLWENMGSQFQIDNFQKAFDAVKYDENLLLGLWYRTDMTADNGELAKRMFEYSKDNIDLFIDIYKAPGIMMKNKFEEAMKIQEGNFGNQLRLWQSFSEYGQKINVEWFNQAYEKHKENSRDILNLWNVSVPSIQKNNPQILERVLQSEDLPKAGYSYLLQHTPEEMLTEDVMTRLMEKVGGKDAENMLIIYNKLKTMNPKLNSTLNLNMLTSEVASHFDIDKLVKLSTDVELQRKIEARMQDTNFMSVVQNIVENSKNWTLEVNTICENLDEHSELLNNLEDKKLDARQLKQLYFCLLDRKNWFNVNSIEELENYTDRRKQICCDILEGKNIEGKLSEDFYKLTDEEKKLFAILELSYGMDLDTAKNIVYKYGKDIDQIAKERPDEEAVKEIQVLATMLKLSGKEAEELYKSNKAKIQNWDEIEFSAGAHIEEQALEMYEQMYREALKTQEVALGNVMYGKKQVPVTEIVGDFKSFIRVEGAYSEWEEPEDFSTYFDEIDPYGNGNCKSFVANDLFARARPKGPTFGYNQCKDNSLLIMAPWDIVSNSANYSFSTSSASWDYKKGIQFRTPEMMIDSTRDNHNEVVTQKWFWNEQTQKLERDKPDFVIYVKNGLKLEEDPQYKMSVKAAAQLGLPMKIIDFEKNIQREQQKVGEYLRILNGDIPNNTKMDKNEIVKRVIVETENNRVAMRFADQKMQEKYFTPEIREVIYNSIGRSIEACKESDPEKYRSLKKSYNDAIIDEMQKEQTSTGYATDSKDEHKFYVRQIAQLSNTKDFREFRYEPELEEEIKESLENVSQLPYYEGNKAHSIEHIERVTLFAGMLAGMEGLDAESRSYLLAAAAFHDSGRAGRDGNEDHAEASAVQARQYLEENPDNPFGITKGNIGIIQTAIHYHEWTEKDVGHIDEEVIQQLAKQYGVKKRDIEKTEKICELLKDADALDRCRFVNRATLNPAFLRSKSARNAGMINFARNVNNAMAEQTLINEYGMNKSQIIKGKEVAQLRGARIEKARVVTENYVEPTIPINVLLQIIGLEKNNEMQKSNEKLMNLYEQYGVTKEDIENVARTFEERMHNIELQNNEKEGER